MSEQEKQYVTQLMASGYPDQLSQAAQILDGIAELIQKGVAPFMHARADNNITGGNNNRSSPTNSSNTMHHGRSNTSALVMERARSRIFESKWKKRRVRNYEGL